MPCFLAWLPTFRAIRHPRGVGGMLQHRLMLQNCHPLPKCAETPTGMLRQGRDYSQWERSHLAVVLRGADVSTSPFALEERRGRGADPPLGCFHLLLAVSQPLCSITAVSKQLCPRSSQGFRDTCVPVLLLLPSGRIWAFSVLHGQTEVLHVPGNHLAVRIRPSRSYA